MATTPRQQLTGSAQIEKGNVQKLEIQSIENGSAKWITVEREKDGAQTFSISELGKESALHITAAGTLTQITESTPKVGEVPGTTETTKLNLPKPQSLLDGIKTAASGLVGAVKRAGVKGVAKSMAMGALMIGGQVAATAALGPVGALIVPTIATGLEMAKQAKDPLSSFSKLSTGQKVSAGVALLAATTLATGIVGVMADGLAMALGTAPLATAVVSGAVAGVPGAGSEQLFAEFESDIHHRTRKGWPWLEPKVNSVEFVSPVAIAQDFQPRWISPHPWPNSTSILTT